MCSIKKEIENNEIKNLISRFLLGKVQYIGATLKP